jgi:hypothetical protein
MSVAAGAARTIIRSETEIDLLALDVDEAPKKLEKSPNRESGARK